MRHPYVISSGELESLHLQGQQRTGQSVQMEKKGSQVARLILGDSGMDRHVFWFIGESMTKKRCML